MYFKPWRTPIQLELPFPPHELSNVIDLSKRIQNISERDNLGFTSFDPIQLELPFPYPDAPRILDYFTAVNKLSEVA